MKRENVVPGMKLMCPGGCVKVIQALPTNEGWFECEYLWTYWDPHPVYRKTHWHINDLRPLTSFDRPPLERFRDTATAGRGEWPRTLKGRRP